MSAWYTITNVNELDSPALVFFPERMKENIRLLKEMAPDTSRLRPHVKTNKCAEVCRMMLDAGIYKFKCATIAEGEMLGMINAPDVLLAYQPTGPRAQRFLALVTKYPNTKFACLVDNLSTATALSAEAVKNNKEVAVFIDINSGMNRTGITPKDALPLYLQIKNLKGITVKGLHAYDGHLRDTDLAARTQRCDEAFALVEKLHHDIQLQTGDNLTIVAGGTPTFQIHSKRKDVESSPGTFIFTDKSNQQSIADQPFIFAALVVARIASKPAPDIITVDLGHKAIASENPLANRVTFLNAEGLEPIGHSEEHLVLKAPLNNTHQVGDVLYGVPYHICPTVALYETAAVIQNGAITDNWSIISRKRKISV